MGKYSAHTKRLILVSLMLIIGVGYTQYGAELGAVFKVLTQGSVESVIAMIRSWGMAAPLVSILLMILQAFIAPIPAFLITGANGILFGFWWGLWISWFGAMLGAAGTFYLARIMGADFVSKLEKNSQLLSKVEAISEKHGFKVILVARLLPFVSFDYMSYAAGLSKMKAKDFFIATGIGMVPGAVAYILLGNEMLVLSMKLGDQFWVVIALVTVVTLSFLYLKSRKR